MGRVPSAISGQLSAIRACEEIVQAGLKPGLSITRFCLYLNGGAGLQPGPKHVTDDFFTGSSSQDLEFGAIRLSAERCDDTAGGW